MKKVLLTAAFCAFATQGFAGAMTGKSGEAIGDQVVEAPRVPVVPVAGSSAGGAGVVAGGLALVALAAALSSSSSTTTTTN